MRRQDRAVTEPKEIEDFIKGEQILRIAFHDEGDLYIVPVNYGYICDEGRYVFYFHGAKAGRKYELTQTGVNVGFEIDGKYQLMEGEAACDFSAHFQSVIGTGRLTIAEDKSEKIKALNTIMKQTTGKTDWNYSDNMLEVVAVFRLEVEKMSCKRH